MKKTVVLSIAGVLLAGAALFLLSWMPFEKDIQRTIPASVYENGVVTGETTLTLKGEKSRYLLGRENYYNGTFAIDCYEKSCREGVEARIRWKNEPNYQWMDWFYAGDFLLWDTHPMILINEEMDTFAVMFTDGRVVASSEDMYELISTHISYDAETDSYNASGPIPGF